jgi:hypothetical protein
LGVAALEQRMMVEEHISDQVLEWTGRASTRIDSAQEKADKVGDYVKESVIPWETKATHEIRGLRADVDGLKGSGSGE